MVRYHRLTALAAACLLVFTACNQDTTDPDASASTTTEAGRRETVISVVIEPGTGEGFVGARSDASINTCERQADQWTVAGTVRNPTEQPVSYRIYASLVDTAGDSYGVLQIDVERVEPSTAADWSGTLDLNEPDLRCVLRVERTPITG